MTSKEHILCVNTEHAACIVFYLYQGGAQLGALMDALALSEFLTTLGSVCGAPPLTFGQLQQAVVWPLDSTKLVDTYTAMLKFLLLHWVGMGAG
jgi:hypothetical protein